MDILLSNDDGIQAEGLWALCRRFAPSHRLTVVAPDRERSAVGHAITLHLPIRANVVSLNGVKKAYAVNGTPADCIKLAMTELVDRKPDLVVSGINPGANVGVNINYSGTLAAAREAALYGIPAIAVSIQGNAPEFYDDAAAFVEGLAQKVDQHGLPKGTLLNVNIPDLPLQRLKGIRLSRQGSEHFKEGMEKRVDPRQRTYYWYGIYTPEPEGDADVDSVALADAHISITPLRCDTTDYDHLDTLKTWDISI
ncbi:MAG: 5'/3'-nucleotidase SurE [Deltaproteobacteria bacterium]|nr:5'/3'-nucleotidase SurE [Deltaproteobacteria bacterium]MBW2611164.1 5'/3'-nucleotidase SurE [Deltaproteobacteria bacterium]MBW2675956.1 5'/3'-nucleotidase SurE [Deltaproteobacteria bacterium]